MTDMLVSSHGHKHGMQINTRKPSTVGLPRDLWLVVREGSLTDVDFTLAQLKKNGGNINSRNTFGLTPLHIAIWRNHIPIVRRLLAAGADPDARDGESGWSSLHRAMHFNHLAVASILLQSGASISLEDSKFQTPVDLLSGPVLLAIGDGKSTVATEVFSWGSGANYQLGTGNAHIQKLPCKVDALHGSFIKMVSAAKFHSVAVTSLGEVYTWGFGRGGRLGHPDFDIHSGQAAVITPRQVTSGLGSRRVRVIAAAKHHTVVATEGGEVFTWGSNREGQLGYTVDTQPTPRKVNSLKSRIVAVAAANKHSSVISDAGEVFTWGCNKEGQLGYGTSNSASNYTPRVVEYLKGKKFKGVAVAKCHTMVLGADGEVYTWGHRLVTPKRVVINRNLKKSGSSPLKFHRSERLRVAAIAAGMVHSLALTDDGALFYWVSSDPNLNCQQLYSMCGKSIVSISSGKYWSAAVTETGDVYMWDGKKGKDIPPVLTRLHGVKKATSVSVGETHLLMIGSLYHPAYSTLNANRFQEPTLGVKDDKEELDDHFMFEESESVNVPTNVCKDDLGQRSVPSLKTLCEKVAAENLVEPRNVMQMLEIADTLGADNLRKYCEDIAIRNLDYILTVSSHSFATASPEVLANLEHLLDQRSSEPWSYRTLPTPTVTFPVIINSEEEDSENEILRTRDNYNDISTMKCAGDQRLDSFLQSKDDLNQEISKKVRALRKKLQQVEMLETKQSMGHLLDDQQIAKLQMKFDLEKSLVELGVPVETTEKAGTSADVKGSKKAQLSKKQKKKSKHNTDQPVIIPAVSGVGTESGHVKNFSDIKISQASPKKEDDNIGEARAASQVPKEIGFSVQRRDTDSSDSPKGKTMSPSASKKKNRKGGLSMFLSGALDDAPKEVLPSPPTPKSEGPAWGGAKILLGSSLREIQDEQSKMMVKQPTKGKDLPEDHLDPKSDRKLPLSSFFPSKPIPVISTHTPQPSDTEKSTPTWASGTPPLLSRPSLRDIQMQEEKKQRSICQSPKTRMAGFAVAASPGSPSDSSINRWFKPEVEARSSIRSIQIEEKAMKDLKRFYSSVKVVKNTA